MVLYGDSSQMNENLVFRKSKLAIDPLTAGMEEEINPLHAKFFRGIINIYSVSPIYRGWWGPSNGTAI